ncbi:mucin-22-like [Argopecten irradians]|uniref:mucin-22-like n=1 Tax=Argopecten irradians TaxID=31199 RepID=UPI00371DAAE4
MAETVIQLRLDVGYRNRPRFAECFLSMKMGCGDPPTIPNTEMIGEGSYRTYRCVIGSRLVSGKILAPSNCERGEWASPNIRCEYTEPTTTETGSTSIASIDTTSGTTEMTTSTTSTTLHTTPDTKTTVTSKDVTRDGVDTIDHTADQNLADSNCTMPCLCENALWGNTPKLEDLDPEKLAELKRAITKLKAELTVNRTGLSTYKATKVSASDERRSAAGIGALEVQAVNFKHNDVQIVQSILFNAATSTSSSFDDWMKGEYLANQNRTTEAIETRTQLQPQNALFRYNYTSSGAIGRILGGMAFLLDTRNVSERGSILLTSDVRNIGDVGDILFNLNTHTYQSSLNQVEEVFDSNNKDRISSSNHKIVRRERKTGDLHQLVLLRYEMEEGVVVKTLSIKSSGPFVVSTTLDDESQPSEKTKYIQNRLYKEYNKPVLNMEITPYGNDFIDSMEIVFTYTYLPYDVADYFVIRGRFASKIVNVCEVNCGDPAGVPNTVMNGSGTTTGSARTYTCKTGTSLVSGVDPVTSYCHNGEWSRPNITCEVSTTTETGSISITSIETTNGTTSTTATTLHTTPETEITVNSKDVTIDGVDTTTDQNVDHNTAGTNCTMPCSCKLWGNTTKLEDLDPEKLAELKTAITKLKAELTVNRTGLSTYKATKVSASDERRSAAGIGAVGVLIIILVVSLVIMADVMTFLPFRKTQPLQIT